MSHLLAVLELPTARVSQLLATRPVSARRWLEPIAVFFTVRILGLLTVVWFCAIRGKSVSEVLSAWDGQWMLLIAEHGYDGVPYTQTDANGFRDATTPYAFFPGYPVLTGWVAKLPLFSPLGAALTLNVIFGLFAAVAAHRLGEWCCAAMKPDPMARPTMLAQRTWVERWRNFWPIANGSDPYRAGLWTTLVLAATPMSIVFSMAYTEAMFVAFAAWALVGILRRQWLLAAICTGLAGTVRPTALVLIGVLIVAAIVHWRDGWRAWVAIVIAPIGYITYLAVVAVKTGEWNGWFTIQTKGWATTMDWGRQSWNFIADSLVNSDQIPPVLSSMFVILTLAAVIVAALTRLPWPVWCYGAGVVATIVLTGGLMMSRPRLLLPAFVLLIPLAIGLARSNKQNQTIAAIALVGFSCWFSAHMICVYPHAM